MKSIPEDKQPAIERALQAAFGVTSYDALQPLAGGMSTALVFRIDVRGRPYLLRMIMRTDAYGDPTREFTSVQAAADAGIAPRVHYASIADRVLVTDFVAQQPWPADVVPLVAPLLRRVHELPGFPKTVRWLDAVDGFVQWFRDAKLAIDAGDLFERYAELVAVYPRDADQVASHNDGKPQNLLFDGERFWIVDWEAAFVNDRYLDLAVVASFVVHDAAERYLAAYFGRAANEVERARFFLMQQACHVSYATLFALIAARQGVAIDDRTPLPAFRAFHDQLVASAIDLESGAAKVLYARVHLREALSNMASPRFAEALDRVWSAR